MKSNCVPEGLVEVPVPPGVFIGSTDDRLDRFCRACIGEFIHPSEQSLEKIGAEWEEFTPEEKQLLGLGAHFRKGVVARLVAALTPKPTPEALKALIIGMMHRASDMQAGMMLGYVRRPAHVNPPTMLVRA